MKGVGRSDELIVLVRVFARRRRSPVQVKIINAGVETLVLNGYSTDVRSKLF
jgi:hypothetical protein